MSAQAAPQFESIGSERGPRGIDAVKPRVLELLSRTPLRSKNAIVEAVGADRNVTLAAIDVLLGEGAVRETGAGAQRRFEVSK